MFLFSFLRARQAKFEQVWGIIRQKWCLKFCDVKKYAQHEKKCTRLCFFYLFVFWRSLSLDYFSGKFVEIWTQILCTPKTPTAVTFTFFLDRTMWKNSRHYQFDWGCAARICLLLHLCIKKSAKSSKLK